MSNIHRIERTLQWSAGALGIAAIAYAGTVATAWWRYGHPAPNTTDEADPLLDRFMPTFEVAERHHIRVAAPAATTFETACQQDLMAVPIVRAIFKTRELVLGSGRDTIERPQGLLALTRSLGWGVLAEVPGREVAMGAITQPWLADVVFRALPAEEFLAFSQPGFVKIVWTLRADPAGPDASVFRTETRVLTTDATARAKFRWYWARFSPGIVLIRWLSLRPVRRDSERRARDRGAR